MASNNTNKSQTSAIKVHISEAQTTDDSIKIPNINYHELVECINLMVLDKKIEDSYVDDEINVCSLSSFRNRIEKKNNLINSVQSTHTNSNTDANSITSENSVNDEEINNLFNILEKTPFSQKYKSKKNKDSTDVPSCGSSTSVNNFTMPGNINSTSSFLSLILKNNEGFEFDEPKKCLLEYNENKRKINELSFNEKHKDVPFDLYYEKATKLQDILNDFENSSHKEDNDNNKQELNAFTLQQKQKIECISDGLEQFYFIQENHCKLYKTNEIPYPYENEEFEQLTDITSSFSQNLR